MSRVIYIGLIDDNYAKCVDSIRRKSEESIVTVPVDPSLLRDAEHFEKEDNSYLKLYVPFLNRYSGYAAYVHSNFVPTMDIDAYFNHAILNVKKPIVHYVDHDVWILNCADSSLKELNPIALKHSSYEDLISQIGIVTVNKI